MHAGGARVHIALLGGFAMSIDGEPVVDRWRLRKARTLVKLLALAPQHRLTRDAAVDALWPDADPAAAANNLHQAVHAVRQVLGASRLALRENALVLCPDDELGTDVGAFERAAARARGRADPRQLRAALAAWTGPLLPEDADESWCAPRALLLAETRAALAVELAAILADGGDAAAALSLLDPLAAERPTDERVQRARMAALAALGRRWDAIAVYEQLRDLLETEYAAEPERDTKAAYRRLVAGSPAPRTRMPNNLSEPATSFIGRHRELAELRGAADRTRLLTLTGPGGAGKSRLALELARRAAATSEYPDGVWLVELAAVHSDDMVTSSTATVLGLALHGGRPSEVAVADQLATRTMLLVLDNCEHLLGASTELVGEVLARCPDLKVLTTSREPLGVDGELVYRVPSLEQPDVPEAAPDVAAVGRLEAVQLFVDRARQIAPQFRLDADNVAAVVSVCRRLDGMPLALELAAARLAHLTVADLAAGLDEALTLLARRGGARLDRQQTLAATLDWSHDLLAAEERTALRRLSVFAGGFDLAAAAHVCELGRTETVTVLSRLVDKSLLEADVSGASARFRLLEVVRQYAALRLADAGEAERAGGLHRAWYAQAAAEHDPDREAVVGEPSPWFDLELDNLRAALASALVDEPTAALRIATAAWRFWVNRGLILEGSRWMTLALERCTDPTLLRARALAALGVFHARQGRVLPLPAIGDEIAALHALQDDPVERALGRHQRAVFAFMAGDFGQASAAVREVLPRDGRGRMVGASVEHLAGIVALSRADVDEAREHFVRADEELAGVSAELPAHFISVALGWVVDTRSDPPLPYGEETVLLGRRVGALQAAAHITVSRALAERMLGRTDAALPLIAEARSRFAALGDRYGQAYAAAQLGNTLRWAGDLDAADEAFAEAEDLRRLLRNQRSLALAISGRAIVAGARGDAAAARAGAREAVRMMQRTDDVAGVALTSANLALLEFRLGEPAAALRWTERAVEVPDVAGGHRGYGWLLLFQAHLLAHLDRRAEADDAAAGARALFTTVGEQDGRAALQRACKGGVLRVTADDRS